jgi:hypothetical protein
MWRKGSDRILFMLAATLIPCRGLMAQGDHLVDGHWACHTIQANSTMYVSEVWDDNQYQYLVNAAWTQFLVSKYQFKGQGSCSVAYKSGSTFAKIQGDQKNYSAQLRAQGIKVIETGWTFVSAKVSLPYYCFGAVTVLNAGQQQGYFYMTKAIGISPNSAAQLGEAWTKYALELHPGAYWQPRPGCSLLPADPDQQQATFDEWVKQWTEKKYEIVRDDWTYTGPVVATAADSATGYYCQFLQGKLLYITGMNVLEEPEATYDWKGYRSAWADYARKTLKIDPGAFLGGCDTGKMPVASQVRLQRIAEIKGQAGGEVHEVDWKYTKGAVPSAAAAPASPTAVAPAASATTATTAKPSTSGSSATTVPPKPQQFYYCQWIRQPANGQGAMTFYLTEAFGSATPQATLTQKWQQHVTATYHPDGSVQGSALCTHVSPDPASQKAVIGAIVNAAQASKASVVSDEWSN